MHDGLLAVGERDVVELEPARRFAAIGVAPGRSVMSCSASRIVLIFSIAARGRLHLAVELRELLQRLEDELQQTGGRDQRADLERAAVDEPRAGVQNRDGRHRAEELDRREEDRRELLRVGVRLPVGLVERVELVLEGALAVERLHDGHAGDRLGELRRDCGDPCPHVGERHVRAELEPAGHDDPGRGDDERDEAEAPVEQEEADDRCDERQAVDDERRQALVEHVRERVHVARQAGDDPAGLLLREVP